jgi:hypothetical protein
LVSSEPKNGSTFFSGRRIVLHFDERVKLGRVREQLLISPPLSEPPDVIISRGHDMIITLKAPLAANTTYTFSIGEAVQDLSEGNPATGLAFVISTGAHVDSLMVNGRVRDASSGLPADNVLVLVHMDQDTGNVRTAPPAYFSRTDASGHFTLTHLPSGPMHINALRDKNANYRFDLPNEDIAFADSTIDPATDPTQDLFLFRPTASKQFIGEAHVLEDRGWRLALARPAGNISLRSLDRSGGDLKWWPEWNVSRDTVIMWPSDTTLLNGQRFSVVEDRSVLDTLRYRATSPMPFNLTITGARDPESGTFSLISSRPIASIDLRHAELLVDSTIFPVTIVADTVDRRVLRLLSTVRPGQSASLVLYPKAVKGPQGGTNDTTRIGIGLPDERTNGQLSVDVEGDSLFGSKGPWIVELRTQQGKTIRQALADSLPIRTAWKNVPPGSYGMKLIQDKDRNGAWSTGSLVQRLQPERVFSLTDPITVRAGWTVETTWKVAEGP